MQRNPDKNGQVSELAGYAVFWEGENGGYHAWMFMFDFDMGVWAWINMHIRRSWVLNTGRR